MASLALQTLYLLVHLLQHLHVQFQLPLIPFYFLLVLGDLVSDVVPVAFDLTLE